MTLLKFFAVLLAVFLLHSITVSFYDIHADFEACPDCSYCAFADDLASGNNAELPLLALPELSRIAFVFERLRHYDGIAVFSIGLRGPPYSS